MKIIEINNLNQHQKILPFNNSEDKNKSISIQSKNQKFDNFSISDLGKKLNIRSTQKLESSNLTGKAGEVANLMSKSLSKFQEKLEKMYELTSMASQDDLTSMERITMQIEMEDLRKDINEASWKLNEDFSMLSGRRPVKTLSEIASEEEAARTEKYNGDNRKLLERAKDRIINGEEWDIREEFLQILEISEETGEFKVKEGSWISTDDESVQTVHEKIQASGTIDLMSSKTAKEGLKKIQENLLDVNHMRESLNSFLMDYTGDDLNNGGLKVSDLPAEEQGGKFDSILGIMQEAFKNDSTGEVTPPKLFHPNNNKLASMFQRLDRLLRHTSGKLADNLISEDIKISQRM